MAPFDLILLPLWDWKKCEALGFRLRDSHLLRQFLNHQAIRRVLVVARPTTPHEMIATRRWWHPRLGTRCYRKRWTILTQVHEKAFSLDSLVFDLLNPLRLRWGWWHYSLGLEWVIRTIQDAQRYLAMTDPVLMVCTPVSTGPVGRLGEQLLVFSVDDNWLHHSGITRPRDLRDVRAGYELLFARSDLVLANSGSVKRSFEQYRQDIVVLPNGVSPERYVGVPTVPSDLRRIPRPWVGYAGTMTKRIDTDLIAWLADRRPNVQFVFLGAIRHRGWLRPIFSRSNVHYLGDKHYEALPNYLSSFDLTIIPHRTGEYENDGDSLKAFEYLASGKPVVSTATNDINPCIRNLVSRCATRQEFLDALDGYLAMPEQARQALAGRLRAAIPAEREWKNIANRAVETIQAALRSKRGSRPS